LTERIEFLRTLRSVRTFTSDPVPDDVIDDILTVARWSGSSMNAQPWELVVIRDHEMLAEIAGLDGYASHLACAQAGIVVVMSVVDGEQEVWDEGKLAERIMLAAWAHGVGACVGWILGDGVPRLKELLGIPDDRRVRTSISLGYPDPSSSTPTRGRSARKPLEEIVSYERYRS
jgi:nitroreductase